MRIIESLKDFAPPPSPITLTLGNFDGVHLGHQAILQKLSSFKVVLTFSNHPSTVLRPENPIPLIYQKNRNLQLLKTADTIFSIPFTQELAKLSPENFIKKLHSVCPFSNLILGPDAAFGKRKSGERTLVEACAKRHGFQVEYLPPEISHGTVISSTQIRSFIQNGDFEKASAFLGRPYSICGTVVKGRGRGRLINFPTANIELDQLCLPPYGVYRVLVEYQGKTLRGTANLGMAPTVRHHTKPLLEVHINDFNEDLYGKELEVIFGSYIRAEKSFNSIEELKEQILTDVSAS